MAPEGVVTAQAIGHVPPMRRGAKCMFCEAPILDEGAPFIDHIRGNPACASAYEAWLDNLDTDRPSG
ncbi:MAG TPA: hypothetical protein VGR28_07420 [Candidatus Thermoplasmatota archaeon]|jgi:hypothetical protein|nr:hypothetical protein [Candidatus Thermoplasmatota archaeon]